MYNLCFVSNSWDTSEPLRGVKQSVSFNTLEELKETMSKFIYNGEWVEDGKGNIVDIDLKEICLK